MPNWALICRWGPIKQAPETFPRPASSSSDSIFWQAHVPPCTGLGSSHFSKKSWFLLVVPFFIDERKEYTRVARDLCKPKLLKVLADYKMLHEWAIKTPLLLLKQHIFIATNSTLVFYGNVLHKKYWMQFRNRLKFSNFRSLLHKLAPELWAYPS